MVSNIFLHYLRVQISFIDKDNETAHSSDLAQGTRLVCPIVLGMNKQMYTNIKHSSRGRFVIYAMIRSTSIKEANIDYFLPASQPTIHSSSLSATTTVETSTCWINNNKSSKSDTVL